MFQIVLLLSAFSFPTIAASVVEVHARAESSFYESTREIGLTRLKINGWQACSEKKLFGEPKAVSEECWPLSNISGYDAKCIGIYQCDEGKEIFRSFIEGKRSARSPSKEQAKTISRLRVLAEIEEACKAKGYTNNPNALFSYWEVWNDFYRDWNAQFFGIYECL